MLKGQRYTADELMARLKFIVGLSLAFTLTGIVFVIAGIISIGITITVFIFDSFQAKII